MILQKIRAGIIRADNILYFDYTASGQAYMPIEEKILTILKTYANTHSEVSSNAIKTAEYYENARHSLHKTLDVGEEFYIIPCGNGSTEAIKRFQELMGLYIPPATKNRLNIMPLKLPLVLIGPYEHHSNEVSFREALCELIRIPLDKNENIDLNVLQNILKANKGREIIASFSVASNVTGILSDYKEIYKLVKNYGGIVALDGAAASAHMNIDSHFYDALFLSPHKLLGGVGSSGLLIIKKELCKNSLIPTFVGGGTVEYVSRTSQRYSSNFEIRESAGTPGILQFIRASLAYELRDQIGLDVIAQKERELRYYFGSNIKKMAHVNLYCNHMQEKLPIFSLNIQNMNPYDAAKILSNKYNIQVRAGCNCAGPYGHDLLRLKDDDDFGKKPGWVRITLHFTHTKEEIDKLLSALMEM
ncbi:MAG: aminotransferase class V-fold PLP-dependent enzyme [Campylobacteraceae bacterium]|jgi:selenocysteine lyase/cysteine desulfurase|nr:aminotransferase class V-fold PLP-dependent enzyme [Campylobacteraceae bacterium]